MSASRRKWHSAAPPPAAPAGGAGGGACRARPCRAGAAVRPAPPSSLVPALCRRGWRRWALPSARGAPRSVSAGRALLHPALSPGGGGDGGRAPGGALSPRRPPGRARVAAALHHAGCPRARGRARREGRPAPVFLFAARPRCRPGLRRPAGPRGVGRTPSSLREAVGPVPGGQAGAGACGGTAGLVAARECTPAGSRWRMRCWGGAGPGARPRSAGIGQGWSCRLRGGWWPAGCFSGSCLGSRRRHLT